MKLTYVVLRDRIPSHGPAHYSAETWDISFDAGIVTITSRDPQKAGEPAYLVPASNVIVMRAVASAGAKSTPAR